MRDSNSSTEANLTLRRDATGRNVMGDPSVGCRFCGRVSTKVGADDKTVVHHPALECCVGRLTEEVGWRSEELAALMSAFDNEGRVVRDLFDAVEQMDTRARKEAAQAKAERASRNYDRRQREHYNPAIAELGNEIARLKRKRGALRGEAER